MRRPQTGQDGATVVGLILLHRPLSDWRIYLTPTISSARATWF